MTFATIYFAKDILLPVVIGLLLSATLSPLVRGAERKGIAPPITAAVLIFGILITIGIAILFLGGSVAAWMDQAPQLGAELRVKLRDLTDSVEAVQNASEQMETITDSTGNGVQKVVIDQPGLLKTAASSLISFGTSMLVGVILALFFLASGDLFAIKLVQSFSSFTDKKRAIKIVTGIQRRVSHYLLSITLINAGLGLSIGFALYLVGLPYFWIWGAAAFTLNFLPFLGAIIGAILVGAYSVVTFDSLYYAAIAPGIYLFLTSLEGQIVTPYLLGRRLQLNTVAVFLTVVFWGWLWGIPGALMAVPFLVCLKVVCDNVDAMQTFGNFLGGHDEQPVEEPDAVPVK